MNDIDNDVLGIGEGAVLQSGSVEIRPLVDDMKESFMSYAMSVIVSRALPDVRDGLKPVHRRVLYQMHENGLRKSTKHKKCAKIVGDTLGNYHPHGDQAVYGTLARMAQDFTLRYPLVDGQGNFGSIDGDNPASMRYTEARLERITELLLQDIDKDTVPWRPNYDGSKDEPTVLPTVLPQLLLNGSMGIAVGMATNIPPHNLSEILAATNYLLDTEEPSEDDLLDFISGPDFPTGAEIYDKHAIRKALATGRGAVVMRGRTHIEEMKGSRFMIVIDDIPYQVNKAELVERIADLVKDKVIEDISGIRDESNREGIRVVLELKKDAYPQQILALLYKHTSLQKNFNYNMIALIDGIHPRVLGVKEILEEFIKHRFEVIVKRTIYELGVCKARAHILEGLKIALDNIDEVIDIIRKSATKEDAAVRLIERFGLSDKQTKAILDMRLQTLAGLERQKILDELADLMRIIDELEALLQSKELQKQVIKKELQSALDQYGDARRTKVHAHSLGGESALDTIPEEDMLIVLTKEGYIKRLKPDSFKTQNRGGVGVIGATTKDEDVVLKTILATTHHELLFFTSFGRCYKLQAYEIPESSRQAKGTPIVNFLQLQAHEKITEILNMSASDGHYIFMGTTGGTVKKTPLEEFQSVRKSGIIACGLKENEQMMWAKATTGSDSILSRSGKAVWFSEDDVRPMGRQATGVRGIALQGDDTVVHMDVISDESTTKLLVVMENGIGKMTDITEYRKTSRSAKGVQAARITDKTGMLAGVATVTMDTLLGTNTGDILLTTTSGQSIRIPLDQVKSAGRVTQGVILCRLADNDSIASVAIL